MIRFGRTELKIRASFALNLMFYSSIQLVRFGRTESWKFEKKIKNSICRTFWTESNRSESKSIEKNRIEFRGRIIFESFTVLNNLCSKIACSPSNHYDEDEDAEDAENASVILKRRGRPLGSKNKKRIWFDLISF